MSITYNNNIFHLSANQVSYIIGVKDEKIVQYYWGKRIQNPEVSYITKRSGVVWSNYIDIENLEVPVYGTGDYKSPMLELEFEDGSRVIELVYDSHCIYQGKRKLSGLPATYGEKEDVESLEIYLVDKLQNIKVTLLYCIFENGAITRSIKVENESNQVVKLNRIYSASVDFGERDFEVLTLQGAWARERHCKRSKVEQGVYTISSSRGGSSHNSNPFMALVRNHTTETIGEVYAMNFIYSGNFEGKVEVSPWDTTRFQMGINSFDFSWRLEQGEKFVAPEVVLVYTDAGLNGMSHIFHTLYREHLCRGAYKTKPRPILINNWEATYMNFNEEKLLSIAKAGKELGLELFVLDDGWFGERNSDDRSLGDWTENKEKLPNGLKGLADKINELGMQMGIWVEPEMVNPNSNLYREHPDWCLHVNGRARTESRNQVVLDLSRTEVCDYIIEAVSSILENANISYVKWDMNRSMTEIGSATQVPQRQKETAHRYMLGLYYVLETITAKYPEVLFEGCSGGGGRFDGGMLYYMPQIWTSDDTDAYERLSIQYGTSMVYPISTMGCHVSAVPNHQTNRTTSLKMRGDTAMAGTFGYEMDLSLLTAEEKEQLKEQVQFYKANRELIQYGDFYRIKSPFESNYAIWQFVSKEKKETIVCAYTKMQIPNRIETCFKLQGLDPTQLYTSEDNNICLSGEVLMNVGLVLPRGYGDFTSYIIKLNSR